MNTRPHAATALALLGLLLAPAACRKKAAGAEDLPPAAGKGAPERTALPDVSQVAPAEKPAGTSSDRTTGTTVPRDRAEVAPNMSGIIASIEVEEGDRVKKGQILFRLRTSDLSLRVQQAQGAVKSATVALAASRVEYERMQRLLEKNAVEQAQFDRVKAQFDGAAVAAEQSKVALAMARRGLEDATMRSPITGVVTAVNKNTGEMATMMPPTVVVVVEDPSVLELRFRLPESAMAAVTPGAAVTARFEAIGASRAAKVLRISPAVDPRTRTFEVVAMLENADLQLKSGMLAVVDLGEEPPAPPAAPAGAEGAEGAVEKRP